jgi:hypothetical protein
MARNVQDIIKKPAAQTPPKNRKARRSAYSFPPQVPTVSTHITR